MPEEQTRTWTVDLSRHSQNKHAQFCDPFVPEVIVFVIEPRPTPHEGGRMSPGNQVSHGEADHDTAELLKDCCSNHVLSHVELLELQFDHSGAMRSDLRRPGVCLRHPGGALGLAMGSR